MWGGGSGRSAEHADVSVSDKALTQCLQGCQDARHDEPVNGSIEPPKEVWQGRRRCVAGKDDELAATLNERIHAALDGELDGSLVKAAKRAVSGVS